MKLSPQARARGLRVLMPPLVIAALVSSGLLECRPPRSAVQASGERTYARMCAVCHGKGGEGYAADRAPSLDHPDFLATASPDFLRKAIENGRSGSTMSAWAHSRGGPLNSTDVDSLITAIRSWRSRAKIALDEAPLKGDATKGAEIFSRECKSCHGEHGIGGTYVQIGSPDWLGSASNGFLRYAIRNGRAGKGMPGFENNLGDAAIDDVIAELRRLQKAATPTPRPVAAKAPPLPLGP
ncbi:MAG: c-type cytochrome, partial [Polyangiaceae bacterium]